MAKEGKPTVEFRQHECTIDAEVVGRWVGFLSQITKKAERMAAAEATAEDVGDAGRKGVDGGMAHERIGRKESISDLCEWIGLGDEDRGYWVERGERFRAEF